MTDIYISEDDVYEKLCSLDISKSPGPEDSQAYAFSFPI